MLDSEKTTINSVGYQVTKLPYKASKRVLLRLYKALGPALGQGLADALAGPSGLRSVLGTEIGPALGAAVRTLAETLAEDDFDFVVEALAEYTQISKSEGKWLPLKQEMEFHFAGNMPELFQWLAFALRVNYGGFFDGKGLGALLTPTNAASPSQKV